MEYISKKYISTMTIIITIKYLINLYHVEKQKTECESAILKEKIILTMLVLEKVVN